ncbi:hypothetical protein CYMTET_28182 [Cymbomonas tetramitiformis]|uniref:Uncharacterized protein n=1 Tax=Cymbomonas tetramitiformis TaxID=36881 RepID=A0AAE0FNC5_9CHLO|nr:hypothetical protein CYMTET_28182 [Cymbomonas tetramitiformis]
MGPCKPSNLANNRIQPEGVKALAAALTPNEQGVFNRSIHTLHLRGAEIGQKGHEALVAALSPNKQGVFNGSLNALDVFGARGMNVQRAHTLANAAKQRSAPVKLCGSLLDTESFTRRAPVAPSFFTFREAPVAPSIAVDMILLAHDLVFNRSLNYLDLGHDSDGSRDEDVPEVVKALVAALTPNEQGVFNRSLSTLHWRGVSGEAAQLLAQAVVEHPSLRFFNDIALHEIKGPCSTLTELDLSGKRFGVSEALVLSKLLVLNVSVNTLNFEHNNIGPEGAQALAAALTPNAEGLFNGSLNTLDVCFNGITGEAAEQLAKAVFEHPCMKVCNTIAMRDLKDDKLTTLDLKGFPEIGVLEAHMLSEMLSSNASLNTIINAKGVSLPIGALRRNELTKLDLSGKDLEPRDAMVLGRALTSNVSLNMLNLSKNSIGDEGANALAMAITPNAKGVINWSLTKLELCREPRPFLSLLVFSGSLDMLNPFRNEIGDEGAEALAAALTPNEKGVFNRSLNTLELTSKNTHITFDLPIP